jgi:hypothetical protein
MVPFSRYFTVCITCQPPLVLWNLLYVWIALERYLMPATSLISQLVSSVRQRRLFEKELTFYSLTPLACFIWFATPALNFLLTDTSLQAILLLPLSCLFVRVVISLKTQKTFILSSSVVTVVQPWIFISVHWLLFQDVCNSSTENFSYILIFSNRIPNSFVPWSSVHTIVIQLVSSFLFGYEIST